MFDAARYLLQRALCLLTVAALAAAASPARSAGDDLDTVVVHTRRIAAEVRAYAQVEPVAVLPARAQLSGVVAELDVRPGDHVSAGEVLARLQGPDVQAALAKHKAAVRAAKAEIEADRGVLQVHRQRREERLGTRLQIYQAKGRLAGARASLQDAESALAAAQAATRIVSPVEATVLSVKAADGERVEAGEALAVLQGENSLWLRATLYGEDADAVRAGMQGEFRPSGGEPTIGVRVRDVMGRVHADGGRTIGLIATHSNSEWHNGEAGTVTLKGPARAMVTVPSRALVLDKGQWWVLVSNDGHLRKQRVVTGVRRGNWTAISKGLHEGERVVVRNAYLRFHRGVSARYQPPD